MTTLVHIDMGSTMLGTASSSRPAQDFALALAKAPAAYPSETRPRSVADKPSTSTTDAMKTATKEEAAAQAHDASAASALEASLTDTAWAEQPVTPVGITEAFLGARVYGLHLTAQGYLSELDAKDVAGEPTKMAGMNDSATSAVTRDDPGVAQDLTRAPLAGGPAETSRAWSASVEYEADMPLSGQLDTETTTSPSMALAESDARQWSERVLRIGRDGGKGVTAWLRDYRCDENDLRPVLDALIRHARGQGVNLQRIVLNGREVWRAATFISQGKNHAG